MKKFLKKKYTDWFSMCVDPKTQNIARIAKMPPLKSEFCVHIFVRPGLLPSPCFYNFLARTTFVLESLLEAKNPGQDAFLGDLVFTVVLEITAFLIIDCDYWLKQINA